MSPSQLHDACARRLTEAGIAFQSEVDALRIPAVSAAVGDLIVYFENGEITVDIEHVTHRHFAPYAASPTYAAHTLDDCVIEAVEYWVGVLKDEWILWRYPNGAGGSYLFGTEHAANSDAPGPDELVERLVWSGPCKSW